MATVNFSVPEAVKDSFNQTFAGQNKSALVAELMREAVERERLRQRSRDAAARIIERHKAAPERDANQLRQAREAARR